MTLFLDETGRIEMPPKLDPQGDAKRVNIVAPAVWIKKIDSWRRQQADLPNQSEAIRRLVDLGLESQGKNKSE